MDLILRESRLKDLALATMKSPNCDRCLLYSHNPHIVCAVYPSGPNTDHCPDFREDPNAEQEELWAPEGYSFRGDELVLMNHED